MCSCGVVGVFSCSLLINKTLSVFSSVWNTFCLLHLYAKHKTVLTIKYSERTVICGAKTPNLGLMVCWREPLRCHFINAWIVGQGKVTPVKFSLIAVTAVSPVCSEREPRESWSSTYPSLPPPAARGWLCAGTPHRPLAPSRFPSAPPGHSRPEAPSALRPRAGGGAAGLGGLRAGRGSLWARDGREQAGSAALVPGGKRERPGLRPWKLSGLGLCFQPQQQTGPAPVGAASLHSSSLRHTRVLRCCPL